MCAISGIINGSVEPLIDKQTHRGPDASGKALASAEYNLWFGHNRLSIIDLSESGNQPMENDRYVLTYNGEIFNYKELHMFLNPLDYDLNNTPGDTRTLLSYISRFGVSQTLKDLNGMYAFGLYDKLYNKLHLVVDRFAQKPLYYYHDGETFAFASSPAALLHLKDKWKINEAALQSYWKLGSVMIDSIWEGIKKVDGSEIITYDLQKKTIIKERYWNPTFQTNTRDIECLILDAIRKVKVADVPVYIFLSGGIDSTLVASQFEGGHAIHLDSPELKYAQEAAAKFNINLTTVSPKNVCIKCVLKDHAKKCGEPQMSALIPYIVSSEIHNMGVKVAVTSNAADELFQGYARTSDKVTTHQLNHIFRECIDYPTSVHEYDPRLSQGRWLELQTYLKHDLNKTLDFASMASSVEVRAPYLDHRLVEMALSITGEKHGRKKILKDMLRKTGFSEQYCERPKMGFSLYVEPEGLRAKKSEAYRWCVLNGYLKPNKKPISPRDKEYLEMSALSFYWWWDVHKDKIE